MDKSPKSARFGKAARERIAAVRKMLSPRACAPDDDKGKRHGHPFAHGHEEENVIPELSGDAGARKLFRNQAIK